MAGPRRRFLEFTKPVELIYRDFFYFYFSFFIFFFSNVASLNPSVFVLSRKKEKRAVSRLTVSCVAGVERILGSDDHWKLIPNTV